MNKNKKQRTAWVLISIAVIIVIFLLRHFNYKENVPIFDDPRYVIGELTYFSDARHIGKSPGKPSEIKYKYEVNGDSIENGYDDREFNVPSSGPIAGDKYLVIYQKTNPKNSRMLFDYPIKDSADFIRYTDTLKKNPLKLDRLLYNRIIDSDK